jgi:predicted CopG family antitoxin
MVTGSISDIKKQLLKMSDYWNKDPYYRNLIELKKLEGGYYSDICIALLKHMKKELENARQSKWTIPSKKRKKYSV